MTDHPPPPMPSRNLGRRFGARVLDALVLLIPVVLVTSIIGGGFNIGTENSTGREFVATLVGLLVTFAYFVLCEHRAGPRWASRPSASPSPVRRAGRRSCRP